jgi:hypothetical protein
VQYAVVVALRQRAQHSTHVAGNLRQQGASMKLTLTAIPVPASTTPVHAGPSWLCWLRQLMLCCLPNPHDCCLCYFPLNLRWLPLCVSRWLLNGDPTPW